MTPWRGHGSRQRRGIGAALCVALVLPLSASAASVSLTSQHLTTTATCALVSYPAASVYGFDSYVDSGNTAQNNGSGNQLKLQSQTGHNQRIYLQFDLTKCAFTVPATAIVRSATLRLFESGALPGSCRTYDVFRTASAWTEAAITWANQPAGTGSNLPASGQRTSSQQVGSTSCANSTSNAYIGWDVSADVSAFLAGTATNHGWEIRDDAEDNAGGVHVVFSSREQASLSQAPQLLVTYTLV